MISAGNCVVKRFQVDNLVIANIVAATTLEVAVALPANSGVAVGDVGLAYPRDAALSTGLGINPVICRVANTIIIPFVNGTAGAINPADTFDFNIFMFLGTGALQPSA